MFAVIGEYIGRKQQPTSQNESASGRSGLQQSATALTKLLLAACSSCSELWACGYYYSRPLEDRLQLTERSAMHMLRKAAVLLTQPYWACRPTKPGQTVVKRATASKNNSCTLTTKSQATLICERQPLDAFHLSQHSTTCILPQCRTYTP